MRKTSAVPNILYYCYFVGISCWLMGCASLLPEGKQETKTPWHSYAEAELMFAKIIPGKTTLGDLRDLGVDPEKTPNVALLSHADLLRRLAAATPSFDIRALDPGLHTCVSPNHTCFAYEIEQTHTERKRFGNFWLDFLNFDRKTDISGWQFDAIVVISKDTVIYKSWSGKPSIHQYENEHSPLGPLQGLGASGLRR
jgi:hypothetical protein